MKIVESILTKNPCYQAGKKIVVKGLMLHSVGCPQPSAETFIKQWNNAEASRACVHAFIDGNSGIVYQTLPWNHRAWHCGGSGNNSYIGVEMCEPGCIRYTGGASFTCSNPQIGMEVIDRTYKTAVELFSYLCKEYVLDPLSEGVIVSHKEGHERGIASGHVDPDHLWKGMNCSYSMDRFRKDVATMLKSNQEIDEKIEEEKKVIEKAVIEKMSTGDVVSISQGATYYDGKAIPNWVLRNKWIIKSVKDDRVILGKNVSGTNEINSPVQRTFLRKDAAMEEMAETVVNDMEMTISEQGVAFIARYEGCRLEAYKCPAGVWTIGYGHTAGVKQGDRLSSTEEAIKLLRDDLKKYGEAVNICKKKGLISFPLQQCQFDALTSFCYNCGAGNLQKLVEGRDEYTIADKILAYNRGGGKELPGLTRRREEERAMFLNKGGK